MKRAPRQALAIAALVLLAQLLLAAAASAQAAPACDDAQTARLKALYLECDRLTAHQRVGPSLMRRCAAVAAQLQHCAFGGDFDRLIAWWQRERDAAVPVVARRAP